GAAARPGSCARTPRIRLRPRSRVCNRSNGEAPRLERVAAGLRHAGCRPRRIPDHVDPHLVHALFAQKTFTYVVEDELGSGAAHGGEGEVDIDHSRALPYAIDHTEVD